MEVASRKALVIAVSLAAMVISFTSGQELPTRNEDEFQLQLNNEEIFYDTNLIPDGSEVSSYVRKEISSRFFFIVEEDDTPLAIHIAPCSSSITTRIRYQTKPEDYDTDKPDSKDELLTQMQSKDTNKRRRVKKLLQTHTGRDEVKFQREKSPSGLYSVEVIAHDQDTTIHLYASTTPHSDRLFPALPVDANIRVVTVTSDVISVSWKPSPTRFQHGIPVEYCVAANRRQNFGKRCAALTTLYGDVPPTPPPNAGFGFPWEKTTRKNSRKMSHSTVTPPPPDSGQVFYSCVGNKTSFTFSKLDANTLYYIDVFAVNSLTNRSSSYKGRNVSTAACPVQKTVYIGSGKVHKFRTGAINCSLTMRYVLEKSTDALNIAIQSCKDDRLRVNVEMVGERSSSSSPLESELLSEFPVTKFSIAAAPLGVYNIYVTSAERKNVAFKMAVGRVEDGLPFPVLPSDRTIRVINSGNTSCRSTTLKWNLPATEMPQQYCLYMERIKGKGRRQQDPNRCTVVENLRGKAKKITCKTVASNGTGTVDSMVGVVSDLKPSTRYRFEVIARKHDKEAVAYETLDIKTRKC